MDKRSVKLERKERSNLHKVERFDDGENLESTTSSHNEVEGNSDSEGFIQTDSVIGPSPRSEPVRSKEGERGQSSFGSCRTRALSSPMWSRVLLWFSS
ncbi:unnamed protein product [Leuciscus chuanchicus]